MTPRAEDVVGMVRAVLREANEPMEAHEIRRLTGLPHECLYAALVHMDGTGEAQMLPAAGGAPSRLWRLGAGVPA